MVVDGNKCPKGQDFAEAEMNNPTRTLTTTVRTKFPDVPVISVRTDGEIPKKMIMTAMQELNDVVIEEELDCGDTVLENIAETGVRVIITSAVLMNLGAELENKNVQLGKTASTGGIGTVMGPGVDAVRNSRVVDDIGSDTVGGFVGAAGEAVGVEGAEEDDTANEDVAAEEETGKGYVRQKGRPHIKRR
jgi:CxxC motif-containing protein